MNRLLDGQIGPSPNDAATGLRRVNHTLASLGGVAALDPPSARQVEVLRATDRQTGVAGGGSATPSEPSTGRIGNLAFRPIRSARQQEGRLLGLRVHAAVVSKRTLKKLRLTRIQSAAPGVGNQSAAPQVEMCAHPPCRM